MEILTRALEKEKAPRAPRLGIDGAWEACAVGATRQDIQRLVDEGLIEKAFENSVFKKYRLTAKGKELAWPNEMEDKMAAVPACNVIDAMELIIGFDDIKAEMGRAIESRKKVNFLLEGPPACAKSLMLEAVRNVAPRSYMAFGSRTSASGLSDVLFEHKPMILLMDECDKMRADAYSVLLGLMESGEIIETKSQKTRGVKLPNTIVIAACNSSAKFSREFLSRFAAHIFFPEYSRDEFITVCEGFLSRSENAPLEIARLIGAEVFDKALGDVRKARGIWNFMTEPTEAEVKRVIEFTLKYAPPLPEPQRKRKAHRPRLV
jgi:hypothetical protein